MLDFKEQLMAIKTEMNEKELTQKIKVEVKDLDVNKQIKQVKIEVNTNDNKTSNNKINNKETRKEVKKGQLWYVDFGKRLGSLQSGIRPALIDSNDINNRFSNIINVYPLTSNIAKANNIPVHVVVDGFGLKEQSVILIEQDTPIDVRYQLLTSIGTVDELILKKVEKARNIQRGILQEKTPLEKLQTNLRKKIEEKLDDIYTYEKALYKAKNQTLINNLLEQREAFLWSLQKFCEDNNLNYKDYYTMYNEQKEVIVI
jgi:mRNA-degrading endonuclease toxin of MazEF toxin-antitoxin module